MRWSPQVQDTREFDPNESSVQPQGLQRQPESTTEELQDGDHADDDEDIKMLGAACEEPVTTIGLDGETLAEREAGEESYSFDVSGGFLDPDLIREVPVGECGSHKVIKTRWVDTKKRRRMISRNSLPVGGEGGAETQQHGGG